MNDICPKVYIIARLEYEIAYYDSAVHRFNHYTTRTSVRYYTAYTQIPVWTLNYQGQRLSPNEALNAVESKAFV